MICKHFKCGREDLPHAPLFPSGPFPTAHVNPHGEPCPESGCDVYDDDMKKIVVERDDVWGPEFSPGQAADGTTAQADKAATVTPEVRRSAPSDGLVLEGSIPSPGTEKRKTKKPAKRAAKKAPAQPATDGQDQEEADLDDWIP